ncbi:UNVERIFIED_CONTAM: hypothetical protein NCL1_42522 [Trichonephila clavipes]
MEQLFRKVVKMIKGIICKYLNKVVSNIDENLTCTNHEETDTKIHHVCNIYAEANLVMRCSDTDIAAIMLGHMSHLKNDDYHVWILTGLGDKQLTNVQELLLQFQRASYITSPWSNAHMKGICIFSPENNGWTLKDNQYHFNWFDSDQLPAFVKDTKDADADNEDIQYQHWICCKM